MNETLEGFKDYLIEEELSKSTIENYMYSVNNFFKNYSDCTKENVIEWKKQLMENFSGKTVNIRLNGIRKYCEYAGLNIKIKTLKIQKTSTVENVITIEQYNKLINGLEGDKKFLWSAYCKILAKTGARISEALKFRKKDLDNGFCVLHTKGKIRRISFPKKLCKEVSDLFSNLDSDDFLFVNKFGKHISSRGVAEALKRYAKKYGIPVENAHPHAFRHLFAIEFLKRNPNISLLADLMGHSGVNTTMIYLRLSKEQQQNALDDAVDW